jgi:DNA helicase-2/ATP-dependent DNA helicase PcrA
MDLLSSLNEQQREAVAYGDGPLLILAGAGSGKTRVIAHRIAYLIAERGVRPYHILAVTFTNKAAGEMRERVAALLEGENLPSAPLIATFHSLCVRILRQHIEALDQGYTRSFTIYDQDDAVRLAKGCLKDLGYDDKSLTPRSVQGAISRAKNQGKDAGMFAAAVREGDERQGAIARVFKLYEQRSAANNALDFDDLLIKTVQLLRRAQSVRDYYNEKFTYVLVDEYQDTNPLQFALVRFLTEKQQNICVVGDEDQSIYRFRNADITNILNFEQHYPNAKIIRLEQNYRSTQTILDAAGAVVANNTQRKGKTLWTANPSGEKIRYYQAFDGDAEARFVAAMVEEHRRTDRDIRAAVLYRTNAQSRVFEEAMRRANLKYNIVGGFSFYERAEVRDIISYLKLAENPHDSISLMRVINSPPRGLGKQTLDELDRRAKTESRSHWDVIGEVIDSQMGFSPRAISSLRSFREIVRNLGQTIMTAAGGDAPVSDVVKAAIETTGYALALKTEGSEQSEARIANLQELVNAAVDYDREQQSGLRDFIDHAALVSDTDQYKRDAQVTLMTVHSAKGLEFPLVFLVGLEDGLFPHSRSVNDPAELEEERRLAYVAITRAEKHLYVTHSMKRRVYGEETASEPSQFLNELPLEMLEDLSRGSSWLSFARSGPTQENRAILRALSQPAEAPREKKTTNYTGPTYDNAESIAEFFRRRGQQMEPKPSASAAAPAAARTSTPVRSKPAAKAEPGGGFRPGSHVIHAKYGRGLVLRREGAEDDAKLTVTFPGFGQKKLMEKYAGLEKA